MGKTNVEHCKNYYNRKKAAKEAEKIRQGFSVEKPIKKTGAERTRAYRLRKIMLSQANESSVTDISSIPSTSNSRIRTFEPSFQLATTSVSTNRPDVSTVSSTGIADHDANILKMDENKLQQIKLEVDETPNDMIKFVDPEGIKNEDSLCVEFKVEIKEEPEDSSDEIELNTHENFDYISSENSSLADDTFGCSIRMKKDVVPHIFDCQQSRKRSRSPPSPLSETLNRKRLVKDAKEENHKNISQTVYSSTPGYIDYYESNSSTTGPTRLSVQVAGPLKNMASQGPVLSQPYQLIKKQTSSIGIQTIPGSFNFISKGTTCNPSVADRSLSPIIFETRDMATSPIIFDEDDEDGW